MGAKNRYFVTQMESGGSNFFRFLITSLIFFLAMDVASSDRIAETAKPPDGPDYMDIDVPAKYESNPNYDPMGLDWLYKITKNFIDLILKEAFPRDVVTITGDNNIEFNLEDHVSDVLGQYAYVLSLCLIILIFALAMFITGLIVTCCCCCGNGHESQNGKKNTGKKISLISLLIICGVLITVLGICALNSNQRLRDGVQEFPDDIQRSINDAKTFLDVTGKQIEILLKDNFKQFLDWINKELDDTSTVVQDQIEKISKDLSIDDIFKIAKNFEEIQTDINTISGFTDEISGLVNALSKVKNDVSQAIEPCNSFGLTGCEDLKNSIDGLNFDVKIALINEPLKMINDILGYTVGFKDGEKEFDKLKNSLMKEIDDGKTQAKEQIKEAGDTMKGNVDKISSEIKKLKDYLPNKKSGDDYFLDKARDLIDNYDPYMYYAGIAICCIPLSIVSLLAVGMICGFGRTSFLEKTGSFLLLSGRTLMFYLTIVLAAITLIYFLVGVVIQQAVCKSLREPSESVFFKVVDQYDLRKFGLDSTVSTILKSIRKGESAYKVFNLKSQFDLDKEVGVYLDQFKEAVKEIESFATDIKLDQFEMLTKEQIESLKLIEEPDLSNFGVIMKELEPQLINVNFDDSITELEKLIGEIDLIKDKDDGLIALLKTLNDAKTELTKDQKLKDTLTGDIPKVNNAIVNLKENLKLGGETFKDGRDNLIDKIVKAQNYLKNDCPKEFVDIAKKLGDKTYSVCEGYVKRVIDQTENDLGKSGPLGVVLDAILTSVCDKFALQMNSFWFVLLWTMLLFLPTVVISTKLASLYKSGMSHKPVKTIRTPKGKKSKKTGLISEIPSDLNGFANNISGDFDDIILDKWEQYPPRPQAHRSRSQDEYTTPPPYFFPQLSTVSTPPRFDADRADELSKWEQFPPRPQADNSRAHNEHTTPPPYLFPRWKEEYPESMKRSTKF